MLGLLVWVFVIGLIIFFVVSQKMAAVTKLNEEWMKAAGKLKLSFSKANGLLDAPRISGYFDEFPVKVYVELGKKGGNVVPFTVYSISMPEKFDADGFLDKVESGVEDGIDKFRTGHPLIDKLMSANGFDAKRVKALIERGREELVERFVKSYPGLIITDNEIRCKFDGVDENEGMIRTRLGHLIKLAKGLTGGAFDGKEPHDSPISASTLDSSSEAAPAPALSHATAENKRPAANQMPTVSSKPVANQVSTVSSKPAASQTPTESHIPISSFKPAASQMPTVSKAPSMSMAPSVSQAPSSSPPAFSMPQSPKPKEEAAPAAAQAPEPPSSQDLSAGALAKALFSSSMPGQAEKQLFEGVKGKAVSWTGTLKSSNEYGVDFDFGGGEGTKAVFEVCEIEGAFSMKTKVKAVLQLPKGAGSELKGRNGQTVSFSGKLLKFESFAKEIYLTGGSLS